MTMIKMKMMMTIIMITIVILVIIKAGMIRIVYIPIKDLEKELQDRMIKVKVELKKLSILLSKSLKAKKLISLFFMM